MIAKSPGFVNGAPRVLLQAEGGAVALASVAAFSWSGASWWLFAAFILAPDLSILCYLAGPRIGAIAYNTVHVYLGPVILFAAATALATPTGIALAFIWSAHIGNRSPVWLWPEIWGQFHLTHLGQIGRQAQG